MSIPDTPADVSHLDPDTAVSRGTWPAGLAAAGAVCRAVDAVMRGEVGTAPLLLTLIAPRFALALPAPLPSPFPR